MLEALSLLKFTILISGIEEKKKEKRRRKNPTSAYKVKDLIKTFNVGFGLSNFQKDAV